MDSSPIEVTSNVPPIIVQEDVDDDPFSEEGERYYGPDPRSFVSAVNKKGVGNILTPVTNKNELTSNEVAKTFDQLFNDLNETYGLNVKFDLDSFTNTLKYIIEPRNMKAMEVYISEAYSRSRVILYLMYLKAIGTLSQQILDPGFITSNSMSYKDKLILMRELFSYIKSLDEIYEKVKIKDGDIRLKKLTEESNANNNLDDVNVQEFLNGLLSSVKEGSSNN